MGDCTFFARGLHPRTFSSIGGYCKMEAIPFLILIVTHPTYWHEVKMEKRRRVAVYGNSMTMAGIVASLNGDTTLEGFCIDLDSPNARQTLDENDIAAIVFDLSDPPLRLDITLLRDRPGLLLIGVDSYRDELLVLSSHPAQASSMADLVNVIQRVK